MATMKFFNVLQPPVEGAVDGTYYVKDGDRVSTYIVSDGKVIPSDVDLSNYVKTDEVKILERNINSFSTDYYVSQVAKFQIELINQTKSNIAYSLVSNTEYQITINIAVGTLYAILRYEYYDGTSEIVINTTTISGEYKMMITPTKDVAYLSLYTGSASTANNADIMIKAIDSFVKESYLDKYAKEDKLLFLVEKASVFEAKYDSSIVTIPGFIRPDGSESDDDTTFLKTDFLPITDFHQIKVKSHTYFSVSQIAFYDENKIFLLAVKADKEGVSEKIYNIPGEAKYYRCTNVKFYTEFKIEEPVINLMTEDTVDAKINNAAIIRKNNYKSAAIFSNIGFMRPDGTIGGETNIWYKHSDYIDIQGVSKLYMHTLLGSTSVSPAVFFDAEYNFINGYKSSTIEEVDIEISVPKNARYVIISIISPGINIFHLDVDISLKNYGLDSSDKPGICYLSLYGDDNNSGLSENVPIKTLEKAKEILSDNGELIILEGDYFDFHMNLSSFPKITGIGNVRFIRGNHINSYETMEDYDRVFKTNFSSNINKSNYLWQHDIEDEETIILDSERHPFHRGRRARLSSTRIYGASSIQEIQDTTDKCMWYQEDGVLYFSKVEGSDLSINPIVIPSSGYSALTKRNVEISNLTFLYGSVTTTNLSGVLNKISVGFVNNSGAIIYDNCVGLIFRECETFACSNDGFNGHTSNKGYDRRTSVRFENCYSHDNTDDGESCHEYCDIVHDGGLYEYNNAGITPASGGHATCYNVIARNNNNYPWTNNQEGSGFSAQGPSLDGGIGTNIYCFNCISENNKLGYQGLNDSGSKAINCISINDTVKFRNIEQVNCMEL